MTKFNARSAAFAALVLGAGLASPAFAQLRYAAPAPYAVPAEEADVEVVPPNAIGQFTCAFNERRTHLSRQNCGGTRFPAGTYGYDRDAYAR